MFVKVAMAIPINVSYLKARHSVLGYVVWYCWIVTCVVTDMLCSDGTRKRESFGREGEGEREKERERERKREKEGEDFLKRKNIVNKKVGIY